MSNQFYTQHFLSTFPRKLGIAKPNALFTLSPELPLPTLDIKYIPPVSHYGPQQFENFAGVGEGLGPPRVNTRKGSPPLPCFVDLAHIESMVREVPIRIRSAPTPYFSRVASCPSCPHPSNARKLQEQKRCSLKKSSLAQSQWQG